MTKIDRFAVLANTRRELLFAWARSSPVARATTGHLYVERSHRTQNQIKASHQNLKTPDYIAAFPGVPKHYGDIMLRVAREPVNFAVDLPALEATISEVIAAVVTAACLETGPLPRLPALIGSTAALEELLRDWRAEELFAHIGQRMFPGPQPLRYAF